MERRAFGATEMEVSVLGFGGSEIGFGGTDQADVDRLLNSALDAGLNVIDTGECYIDSEEKIGKAVGHRRDDYFLFTKCGHASGLPGPDWDVEMLRQSIDRSLQRLQTDCLDLIQLHSCEEALLRQGDVIDVLLRAKAEGKTRFIGYSGDQNNALYAVQCGAFDSLQTSISIADQEAIQLTLPLAAAKNMGVIAKRPVANVAWLKEPAATAYGRTYWERLQKLKYPFLDLRPEEIIDIALRFTLAQTGVSTAIVGTSKPARWESNAKIVDRGPLPGDQIQAILDRWAEVATPDWTGQR